MSTQKKGIAREYFLPCRLGREYILDFMVDTRKIFKGLSTKNHNS